MHGMEWRTDHGQRCLWFNGQIVRMVVATVHGYNVYDVSGTRAKRIYEFASTWAAAQQEAEKSLQSIATAATT
jgi:hypothetical protein